MIIFTEENKSALIKMLDAELDSTIDEGLYNKKLRISDTNITYRQANSLTASNIITDSRGNKTKGWREFSIHDIIFFTVLSKCRDVGLNNSQIRDLSSCFYENEDQRLNESNFAIKAAMSGLKVTLMIVPSEDFKAYFVDLHSEVALQKKLDTFIFINFNKIIDESMNLLGRKDTKVSAYYDWLNAINASKLLTKDETEILSIIRNKDYTKVTIMKKGSGGLNVYGESTKEDKGLNEKDLVKIIKEKSFSNIKVHKRDGKIVTLSIEDVYKI